MNKKAIKELVKIAQTLDDGGHVALASQIDEVITALASATDLEEALKALEHCRGTMQDTDEHLAVFTGNLEEEKPSVKDPARLKAINDVLAAWDSWQASYDSYRKVRDGLDKLSSALSRLA